MACVHESTIMVQVDNRPGAIRNNNTKFLYKIDFDDTGSIANKTERWNAIKELVVSAKIQSRKKTLSNSLGVPHTNVKQKGLMANRESMMTVRH